MKNKTFEKYILSGIVLFFALIFVAKFGGLAILKNYIEAGVGNCQRLPILCMRPEEEIINPKIDKEYLLELLPYRFPEIQVYIPKGFTVIKESIVKVYYKKKKRMDKGDVVYLLYEKPNFFMDLFPQLKKQGIKNDYEFFFRIMNAMFKNKNINNLSDAFFIILKGVFIPDLGDQKNIKMVTFTLDGKRGFINYDISASGNYFDCNVFNFRGDFFKIYIKDKGKTLDLSKVVTIISTINKGA